MSSRSDIVSSVNARVNAERAWCGYLCGLLGRSSWTKYLELQDHVVKHFEDRYTDNTLRAIRMHHNRVQSMTSEDQDHDHGYTDESSNEASSPKRRKVSATWVNVSCQLCKTRKVKCDRTLPSCGWCTRNNAVCEYKERKKPGLRAGYGRELEQRLDRLEAVLLRHEEMLTTALGGMQVNRIQSNHANEITWRQPSTHSPAETPYTFPPRESDYSSCSISHSRQESTNNPYSTGQHHRDIASYLPPINTTHDRRPSVTFMNNPTAPTPTHVKLSASQSPPQLPHSILKHSLTSVQSQCPPLPTPDTTNNSSSHSPQHVQDYLTSRPTQSIPSSCQGRTKELRQRYPFNATFKHYEDKSLPPWPVLYELAISYFVNINTVFPLISECTVFELLLHPRPSERTNDGVRPILMAITVVAMRFLSRNFLTTDEKERYVKKCRTALAEPSISKTREGAQALAILVLSGNGEMRQDETATILSQVNQRLWQKESREEKKPQSPLSVNEMLCRS